MHAFAQGAELKTVQSGADRLFFWVLFCLIVITVPVLYYMFAVGGFVPLIVIAAVSFKGTWGFALFNAVHLLAYGALFYWIAKVVCRRLALLPQRRKVRVFAGLSAALVGISFLPVYGVGHNVLQTVNLYRLLYDLLG